MTKLLNTRNILLSIFIFINITFCVRYAIRISIEATIISTIIYLLLSVFTIKFCNKNTLSLKQIFLTCIIWVACCIVLLQFVPLETIRVDRIEMIELFWNAVNDGEYPYSPRGNFNGNHPGPMPIYFILCYPFYLIKTYALIPILSYMAWIYYTYHTNRQSTTLLLLLIIFSPACYWEVLCRSTIIFNTIIFLIWFVSLKSFDSFSSKKLIISAIIGGLLLSTRSILVVPIIAFGIYALHHKLQQRSKTIIWGFVLLATFIATHIPLLFYGIDKVIEINPITIQTDFFIPSEYMILFIILLSIISYKCTNFNRITFISGIFLFAIALLYIVRYIFCTGLEHSITMGCDISYFLFSLPFLFYSLENHD